MATSVFKRVDDHFSWDGNRYECIFGSDEEPPLAANGTFPAWCDPPISGAGFLYNEGSVGIYNGMWFDPNQIHTLKKWQFTCCTNACWE